MSNTKGSMLISNANAVGTELVNQLGGTGYKPSEWADAINLLGISDDDKASALAGITEGTYTGIERGAIKYINCNAVGSMLNKKFSTNRGFKPVEWESAISKLTPLTEGTVSGAICNIVNGAEDVPLKNWLVTLPANLSGYSEVNGKKIGESVFFPQDIVQGSISESGYNTESNYRTRTYAPTAVLPNTEYHIKVNSEVQIYEVHEYQTSTGSSTYTTINASETTITTKSTTNYMRLLFRYSNNALITPSAITYIQCTTGTLTPYTTYTASLGRTIYGGTADIVTGEGEDENGNSFTFTPITPTPETALGVNNFWADEGDSTITYRKDPDIPDPPVQLLNMNNNNEDNNEGV